MIYDWEGIAWAMELGVPSNLKFLEMAWGPGLKDETWM